MIDFIKRLILFILFTSITYLIYLIIWANIPYSNLSANFLYNQGGYGHLNYRLKEIVNYGEVDILFVGSSRIYRGFDPRIFEKNGLKIFVLGSSGQSPAQSYVMLRRYINFLKPRLIVFDILPSTFSKINAEPYIDLISNDKIDILSLKMAIEANDLMVWNTLIYAWFRQIVGLHDSFKENTVKIKEGDTYIYGGYVHKKLKYNQKNECEPYGIKSWDIPLKFQLNWFNKSIELCNEIDAKIIFINMPIANYFCYDNNNEIFQKYFTKYKVIDYNLRLNFNSKHDFYDNFHLNEFGVSKLNENFIKFINLELNEIHTQN
jgi:predicted nucleic acid-binding protein